MEPKYKYRGLNRLLDRNLWDDGHGGYYSVDKYGHTFSLSGRCIDDCELLPLFFASNTVEEYDHDCWNNLHLTRYLSGTDRD